MYRHDYIIRLIERFGVVLRSLRDRILRRERQDVSARAELGEIARLAGLDVAVARTLDHDMLLMWLAPTGDLDPAKLWLMAELLYLEALDAKMAEGSGWEADFERAAFLLSRLEADWRPGERLASAGERLIEIRSLLPGGRP